MTEVASAFASLPLLPELLGAVADLGFTELTPIQAEAIPPLLAGQDVVGSIQDWQRQDGRVRAADLERARLGQA